LAAKIILQILRLYHRDLYGLSKLEPWNFTKNQLLKRVISVKMDFFCRLKSEHNYSEKSAKNACFMDDALKTRGDKYSNIETLFAPISKFLATCLVPENSW